MYKCTVREYLLSGGCCVIISVSSVGFAIVLKLHFVDFVEFLLWVVFVDCISVGVVVATTLWCVVTV